MRTIRFRENLFDRFYGNFQCLFATPTHDTHLVRFFIKKIGVFCVYHLMFIFNNLRTIHCHFLLLLCEVFSVSTRKRKIYSIGVHERMRYAQTISMKCEIYGRNWYLKSTIGITFGPRHNSTDISKFYCSFLLFFYRLIPWLLLFNWMKQIIEFKHTFWSIFPVVISTAGKLI